MCSGAGTWTFLQVGFPIRTSPDHRSVVTSPGLFADSNVLHRLSMPRHPPCALSSLLHTLLQDARVHCEVLKIRPVPHSDPTPTHQRRAVHREERSKKTQPTADPSGPNSVLSATTSEYSRFLPLPKKRCTDKHRSMTGQLVDVH